MTVTSPGFSESPDSPSEWKGKQSIHKKCLKIQNSVLCLRCFGGRWAKQGSHGISGFENQSMIGRNWTSNQGQNQKITFKANF
ncbi:hypothetical protein L596_009456 [Steinernema carpocapsae]|uniref:Uncharacterized protein n=1 Tax=Steinernema carpocapsae TaxID=34508 RepID=A0A4V6XWM3_STECR|nr:hypothetical protein L596_009456 [Steinernema carpocapsae]